MGFALEVRQGQLLSIPGKQILNVVAFSINERFDQAHSRTNQLKIFLTGESSRVHSRSEKRDL